MSARKLLMVGLIHMPLALSNALKQQHGPHVGNADVNLGGSRHSTLKQFDGKYMLTLH